MCSLHTSECVSPCLLLASGSDIVKLYDLTTLCEEAPEEKCQNPFTLPVAVLLYKCVLHLKHLIPLCILKYF